MVGIAAYFVLAAIVQWLWNCIVPWVIGFPPVTYWQAAGLLLLTRLLFGGLGRLIPGGCQCRCCQGSENRADRGSGSRVSGMNPLQREEYNLRSGAFLEEVEDI